VRNAAAASAAGDNAADRAQLHPQIVCGQAGGVYSPAVLGPSGHNTAHNIGCEAASRLQASPRRQIGRGRLVLPYEQGLIASLVAGLATGIGGIPVLLGRRLSHRVFDGMVGFAAGVMIAISGYEIGAGLADERVVTLAAASIGGGAVLGIQTVPRLVGPAAAHRFSRGPRVALVVTLHNLVEGLMVIATFARSGATVGLGVALAIALHNIPEGLAIAEPLRRGGVSGWRCVALATLSGLGEPLGALLAVAVFGTALPPAIGSALAAGAMIVLAAIELIPEAFSHSYAREAAVGLLGGIVLALGLMVGPG
jgi:ZIP family zinc transporter